jgi:hypothetical protein
VDASILEPLVKLGGVTALVIGVFYLLYKQMLAMPIFAKMSKNQTFTVLLGFGFLTFILAIFALSDADQGIRSLVWGNNNTVYQEVGGSHEHLR